MIKGIPNIGNTCFLNTCLQILLQTPELDFEEKQEKDSLEKHLWIAWKNWKASMVSPAHTFDFQEFTTFFKTIQFIAQEKGHSLFTGYVQNDLSEFLLFFMDTLHEYFKRPRSMKVEGVVQNETDVIAKQCYEIMQDMYKKEYSEIVDTFYGVSISTIYTIETVVPSGKVSSKPEMFFLLDLPIPSVSVLPLSAPLSIYSCFDHYISPEYMENGWIDETTKQTKSVYKNIMFWNFPKILVITLQRFQTIFSSQGQVHISKKMDLVYFPIENLDLSKYVVGYHPRKYIYDLYGVVNHIGDVHGGHYTAFVLGQDKKWYHCNDDRIEMVQDPRQIITPMAYVFFYRIRSS